eukprot:COSAG06_NODE_7349_length_2535_cov_7.169540_3_plen_84_part_01
MPMRCAVATDERSCCRIPRPARSSDSSSGSGEAGSSADSEDGTTPGAVAPAAFDAAVGRYVYLEIEGVEYRVYFEEAGSKTTPP